MTGAHAQQSVSWEVSRLHAIVIERVKVSLSMEPALRWC